jgi:hypothetical protein
MEKTMILVTDPEISRLIPSDGMHNPAREGGHGREPASLKVGDPARCEDPYSSVIILKERPHII